MSQKTAYICYNKGVARDLPDMQNKKDPPEDPATDPTFDDDVGEMVEDFTGEEPKDGEVRTVSDMVNDAERNRRIGPDEAIENEGLAREPGVERLEDLEQAEEEEENPDYEG